MCLLIIGIPPVAAATDGGVQFYIEPSNLAATACVDQHCQVTTLSSEGQEAAFTGLDSNAWHTVTVKADGYQDYSQTFYLTPGTQVIEVTLQPVPTPTPVPTGSLEITVSPKGGTACIDGTQCQNLPLDLSADGVFEFYSLAGNTYHTLTITQSGYQPYTDSIYINAGMVNGESVTLVPQVTTATPAVQVTVASTTVPAASQRSSRRLPKPVCLLRSPLEPWGSAEPSSLQGRNNPSFQYGPHFTLTGNYRIGANGGWLSFHYERSWEGSLRIGAPRGGVRSGAAALISPWGKGHQPHHPAVHLHHQSGFRIGRDPDLSLCTILSRSVADGNRSHPYPAVKWGKKKWMYPCPTGAVPGTARNSTGYEKRKGYVRSSLTHPPS